MNVFVHMVILLGKENDMNIFNVKNKYGFEFTQTPFHTLLNSMLNVSI